MAPRGEGEGLGYKGGGWATGAKLEKKDGGATGGANFLEDLRHYVGNTFFSK